MSWDILPKGNLQYFLQKLKARLDLKVDKEAGKGLSTQDYTNADKAAVQTIANKANDVEPNENYVISNHQITYSTDSNPTTINSFITKLRTLVINVMDDIRTWLNAEIDFNYPALGNDHKFNMGVITQSSISDFSDAVEDALDEVARGFNDHADWVATKADKTEISGSKSVNGNPIAISDAANAYAEEVIANIEPIQDLHGYDHPWVGGAGKNLLPLTVDEIKGTGQDSTWSNNSLTTHGVTFTIITDNDGNVTKIDAKRVSSYSSIAFLNLCFGQKLSGNYLVNGGNESNNFYIRVGEGTTTSGSGSEKAKNVNGDTAFTADSSKYYAFSIGVTPSFTGSYSIFPMIRLATETDPTFEPHTNISPITGITQLDIAGCGKNLYDKSNGVLQGYPMASYTWHQSSSDANELSIMVELKEGEAYTVKRLIGANCVFRIQASATSTLTNGQSLQNIDSSGGNDITEKTFTVPTGYPYVIFYVRNTAIISSLTIEQIINAFQVESGSTATTYEPYTPNNHTTDLGRTVYGGKLNVQTGELVVDRGFINFNGSEFWQLISVADGNLFRTVVDQRKNGVLETEVYAITNRFEVVDYNLRYNNTVSGGAKNVDVIKNDITTVADWKTYLASNPLQVCYELATPITYQLTTEQVKLLKNYNYISTNADALDLTYQVNNVLGEILAESEGYTDRAINGKQDRDVGNYSKNLFNAENMYGKYDNGFTSAYNSETNEITVSGKWFGYWIIKVKRNTVYTISRILVSYTLVSQISVFPATKDGQYGSVLGAELARITSDTAQSISFNTGEWDYISVLLYSGNYSTGTCVNKNVQLEEGDGSDYQQYIPTNAELYEMIKALQQNNS